VVGRHCSVKESKVPARLQVKVHAIG
jgi:hypothetical protein